MNQRRSKAARKIVKDTAAMVAEADLLSVMRVPLLVRMAYSFGFHGPYRRFTSRFLKNMDRSLESAVKKTARVVARAR
jgi:hypothetical protein